MLNPTGEFVPVDIKPLAPRLDTIDGKTIYIIQGEADAHVMPYLAKLLPEKYPKTKWEYYDPLSSFGPTAPDDTVKKNAQAVIRGVGW